MTSDDDGALSFGAWNATGRLTADDSHGDAGCVIIDVSGDHARFSCECFGGYLRTGKDELPVVPAGNTAYIPRGT